MGISTEQREHTCVITCDGTFTAPVIKEVRSAFIKGLIDADQVVLDFGAVTSVDLAGMQLLCSAHRTAGRMNKTFSLAGQVRPAVLDLAAKKAGFIRHAGCVLDVDEGCLWKADRDGSLS